MNDTGKKRRVVFDAGSSAVQLVVAAISLFALYKFLFEILGPAELGIWSLIIATSSLVQLANFGLAGSVIKQVSELDKKDDRTEIASAIETATISMAVVCLVVAACAYPIARRYLQFAIQDAKLSIALDIMPIALIAFWLMMISSVYQGALYGCRMVQSRNVILCAESITYLLMALVLARKFGLYGLVYARLVQNLLTMLATIVALRRYVPELGFMPYRWKKQHFSSVIGYASRIQLVTLLVLICDPLTKACLGRFGATETVGYYEMANRLIQQFRSLYVAISQLLVPEVARMDIEAKDELTRMYVHTYGSMFLLSVVGYSSMIAFSPFVSHLWLGYFQSEFVKFSVILNIGWMINTLCLPAYNVSLGTGWLRGNVMSHVVMTASNVALSLVLGKIWGGDGVVCAWALALAAGGLSLCLMFQSHLGSALSALLPEHSARMIIAIGIGLGVAYPFRENFVVATDILSMTPPVNPVLFSAAAFALFSVWLVMVTHAHPTARYLGGWLMDGLRKIQRSNDVS